VKAGAERNEIGVALSELKGDDGKSLPPGLYYLTVDGGAGQSQTQGGSSPAGRQLLARTTLNVTLKTWADGALAWVTDLKSGQPVGGAAVHFTDGGSLDQRQPPIQTASPR